jgi:quinolinate synthase
VLFLPDQFLGAHVRRMTGRENIQVWLGECHVHAGISPSDVRDRLAEYPDAELLVHPECGCANSVIWLSGEDAATRQRARILSTGGMVEAARTITAPTTLVATEIGMLHQLGKANPRTRFVPMNARASCRYMKMSTPELLVRALRDNRDEVLVDPGVAARARRAVERMIAIGNPGGGE